MREKMSDKEYRDLVRKTHHTVYVTRREINRQKKHREAARAASIKSLNEPGWVEWKNFPQPQLLLPFGS